MRPGETALWIPIAAVFAASPAHATQYLTLAQAQKALFPGAGAFEPSPIALTPQLKAALRERSGQNAAGDEQPAWSALQGDKLIGRVFLDEVIGKHERITYAVGIGVDGAVRGVEILDYRETRGGEVRDPRWRAQFVGKRADSALRLDEDIQNISGATLSCRHVTDGVRRLVVLHALAYPQP